MDKEARYVQLIEDYGAMVSKICRGYSDPIEYEDLRQEVFYQIWRSIDSFQGKSQLSTWLYRLTLNVCMTHSRNKSKKAITQSISLEMVERHVSPEEDRSQIDLLYNAIGSLGPIDKSVIMLYLDKLTHKEIANILGIGKANVGVRINRIKKKLKSIIDERNRGNME